MEVMGEYGGLLYTVLHYRHAIKEIIENEKKLSKLTDDIISGCLCRSLKGTDQVLEIRRRLPLSKRFIRLSTTTCPSREDEDQGSRWVFDNNNPQAINGKMGQGRPAANKITSKAKAEAVSANTIYVLESY